MNEPLPIRPPRERKPDWIRVKAPGSPAWAETRAIVREHGLVTVSNRGGRVQLRAGQGTNLTSSRIAPTPAVPWGQPRIAAAYASVS